MFKISDKRTAKVAHDADREPMGRGDADSRGLRNALVPPFARGFFAVRLSLPRTPRR
jgi:hypothetical protein